MVNRRFQLKGVSAIWAQGQDEHFTIGTGGGVRCHAIGIHRFRESHRFTLRGHAINQVGGQVKLVTHHLIRPLSGGEVAVFTQQGTIRAGAASKVIFFKAQCFSICNRWSVIDDGDGNI